MGRGDWVLFYFDRQFPICGRVLVRERSPAVSRRLWGSDQGATWEYLYLLDEVREVEIPRSLAMRKIGYKENFVPRGFVRVARNLEEDFGSIEQLILELSNEAQGVAWDLAPGGKTQRTDLHEKFGGSRQGRICPSLMSPNVLIFSDSELEGSDHAYDGWHDDGCFHYTGEGQRGDQKLRSGNAAILYHAVKGRALRLFDGTRGAVTYIDEVELDGEEPFYRTDAPGVREGELREVIVFRLRPKQIDPAKPKAAMAGLQAVSAMEIVPIEKQQTEWAYINPNREPYEAERREQKLVLRLESHLRSLGHEVFRQRLFPPGEARPVLTDLYDATTGTLVEAKGTVERSAIRMAIGQLADYRRFVDGGAPRHLAVLLPAAPRADLCDLLSSQGIEMIYPNGAGFADSTGGALVDVGA